MDNFTKLFSTLLTCFKLLNFKLLNFITHNLFTFNICTFQTLYIYVLVLDVFVALVHMHLNKLFFFTANALMVSIKKNLGGDMFTLLK